MADTLTPAQVIEDLRTMLKSAERHLRDSLDEGDALTAKVASLEQQVTVLSQEKSASADHAACLDAGVAELFTTMADMSGLPIKDRDGLLKSAASDKFLLSRLFADATRLSLPHSQGRSFDPALVGETADVNDSANRKNWKRAARSGQPA